MSDEQVTIIDLPEILLEMILSRLSYDEIAKCRLVCKTFNEKCKQMLNKASKMAKQSCMDYLAIVKAQLPRRESEKNDHPLLPTFYVLESMKNSLVKLSFTYDKYIEADLCCFIPGKIIDETLGIIRHLKNQEMRGNPLTFTNVQEVLQEFNDIKGLAIEHFEDNQQPAFERKLQAESCKNSKSSRYSHLLDFGPSKKVESNVDVISKEPLEDCESKYAKYSRYSHLFDFGPSKNTESNDKTSKRALDNSDTKNTESLEKMQQYMEKVDKQESKMREYIDKIEKQESKMKLYERKIQNQDLKMQEYAERIKNQDSKIQEYAGKIRSQDLKMQDYSRTIQNQDAQLAKVTKSLADLNQKLRSIGIGLLQD